MPEQTRQGRLYPGYVPSIVTPPTRAFCLISVCFIDCFIGPIWNYITIPIVFYCFNANCNPVIRIIWSKECASVTDISTCFGYGWKCQLEKRTTSSKQLFFFFETLHSWHLLTIYSFYVIFLYHNSYDSCCMSTISHILHI